MCTKIKTLLMNHIQMYINEKDELNKTERFFENKISMTCFRLKLIQT